MGQHSDTLNSWDNLKRVLTPPIFPADDDATRLARALYYVVGSVTVLLLLMLIVVVVYSREPLISGSFVLLGLAANGLVISLVRAARIRAASLFYVSEWWIIVAVYMLLNGGLATDSSSLFVAIIAVTALFLGWRASIVAALITLIYGLALAAAPSLGYALPSYPAFGWLAGWLVLAYSLILVLIPVIAITDSLQQALRFAKEQLARREQVEQSLRESEQRFRKIFELTQAAMVIADQHGKIVGANPTALAQMGRSSLEEVIGRDPVELGMVRDAAAQRELVELLAAGGGIVKDREISLYGADGTLRTALFSATTLELNGVPHTLIIAVDITDRKRAETALLQENELVEAIINTMPGVFYFYDISDDLNGKLLRWNKALERWSGYSLAELGEMRIFDWFRPEDVPGIAAAVEAALSKPVVELEAEALLKDGTPTAYLFSATSMRIEGRRYLIGVGLDITERRRIEAALRESEDRYRIISEMISDYAYAADVLLDGSIEQVWITESSYTRLTGYTWSEIGSSFDLYHPEDAQKAQDDVIETIKGRETPGEYRILTKDGRVRWLYLHRKAVWDADRQRVVRYYGAAQDITERKLAADALRRSEALLRALLDATTDVAFLMSRDGLFLTANRTMADSMRLSIEEMVGRVGLELLQPDVRDHRRPYFDQVIETGQPVRWEDASSDATWWDNSIYPVVSSEGLVEALAIYSRNITDRKRLEAELRRYAAELEQMVEERTTQLRHAKEQMEIILNNTSDALALSQSNGDIQTLNPAFIAMFDQQSAQTLEHLLWAISDDTQIAAVSSAMLEVIYDNEGKRVEAQIMGRDGKDKDIDLALIPVRTADGDERLGVLVSARDITHLKEVERFKARFVADAVHDLATPISGLSTRLYMLKRAPERLGEHIRALENQVEHLRNLLADLRTLSRLDRGGLSLYRDMGDLNALVRRVFDTYEPVALEHRQALRLVAAPELPEISIDSRQLERALVNLVANAIRYTPSGKEVCIRTAREGGSLLIEVTDQGIGIAPEDVPHIFERFYRSSQAREMDEAGTGLGLAIVKEIVDLHGGTVAVTSVPEQGSTFAIRLPIG